MGWSKDLLGCCLEGEAKVLLHSQEREREMADGNSNFHSVNQKGVRRLTVETQICPALFEEMLNTK